jgi:hypothetical protein
VFIASGMCLGALEVIFNLIQFPSKRLGEGRYTSAMWDFFRLVIILGFLDLPL